ncbi:MAG: glucosamine-6-phosphate deaminase [Vicinamibacterales bacterium]
MHIAHFAHESALAAALAARLADLVAARPTLVLGLPTGRTPLALYQALVATSRDRGLDWSRVRTFNLDEFAGLGGDDPGSYRRFMQERLFGPLGIGADQVGFLDGRAPDLVAECARYEAAIDAAGGIDLQLLGIGANGHIGFNEPARGLSALTHAVVLEERTRVANAQWFGGDADRVPLRALSMGMATILRSREIVLLATGTEKADVVRRMIEGPVTTELPASFLQLHPHVTAMLDAGAASALSPAGG